MLARARGEIALGPLPRRFVADQEAVNSAIIEIRIQLQTAINQRLDDRLIGHQLRVVLRNRDCRSPRRSRPVQQRDIFLSSNTYGCLWITPQLRPEAAVLNF